MKKIMKMTAMALAAVALVVGFAACSSDDDDNKNTPEEEISVQSTISYDIKKSIDVDKSRYPDTMFNPDFIKTTITYYDENNKEITEEIKDGKFSKTITYKKFPAKVGFTINYELLDENNLDLSKKYAFVCQQNSPTIHIMKGNEVVKSIPETTATTTSYTTEPYTSIKDFKKDFESSLPTYSIYYTIQADGSYTKGKD